MNQAAQIELARLKQIEDDQQRRLNNTKQRIRELTSDQRKAREQRKG